MSRRDNAGVRCVRCRMHESLCVCALMPRIETRTRLVLVIHRLEARKPTNTGQIAAACLSGSTVIVRGGEDDPGGPLPPDPTSQRVLLFPHEDAVPLSRFARSSLPVSLVVPDGTWRQASKARRRVPDLADVPCASLPADEPSTYRLRAEAHAHGLATLEAIARAMGILEGMHVRRALEQVFRAMVERTLWARGAVATSDVSGGIPEGAMRHDPLSGPARATLHDSADE